MTIIAEDRLSDSPYIEMVSQGYTAGDGSTIRPSEIHWHMVFTRYEGRLIPYVVGPLTSSGVVSWTGGAEIIWVKFKLGTFMPHMLNRNILNMETILPGASSKAFWLKGSAWQFPAYDNVETFVDWLARDGVLVRDPVVNAALQDELPDMASRTLRHRFQRATGLTQTHIRQFERARQAEALLKQDMPILDVAYQLGYFDQPHLTRSLKQFIGHTPAQIIRMNKPPCHSVQDNAAGLEYNPDVIVAKSTR